MLLPVVHKGGYPVEMLSAAKFARTLKSADDIFVGFIEEVPENLTFTHRAAHGDQIKSERNEKSERVLDEL